MVWFCEISSLVLGARPGTAVGRACFWLFGLVASRLVWLHYLGTKAGRQASRQRCYFPVLAAAGVIGASGWLGGHGDIDDAIIFHSPHKNPCNASNRTWVVGSSCV
ncbi:hypothetical protein HDK90DRAFT_481866 [Phyllosticta capitalensis]|uniref:Uncharacterized protein n=1 Tax=Phyllosticta capitalensis TaxID=121624 RepID=A0ABR1YSH0_9PEZI